MEYTKVNNRIKDKIKEKKERKEGDKQRIETCRKIEICGNCGGITNPELIEKELPIAYKEDGAIWFSPANFLFRRNIESSIEENRLTDIELEERYEEEIQQIRNEADVICG